MPIWTAWEVLALWLYANGHVAQLTVTEKSVWFLAPLFFVPLLHEFHFYCIHRLLHWQPFYRTVHKLHHRNTNLGPWSGLSMHPIEHLFYFSGFLIYFVLPCHPVHMLNVGLLEGLSPAQGHTDFDRVVIGNDKSVHLPYFAHYLHRQYVDVNYAHGTIPVDKWFGTFHDGSPEADQALKKRRMGRN